MNKEECEKILKWCGFVWDHYDVYYPDSKPTYCQNLPKLDMNFYFRYALPILEKDKTFISIDMLSPSPYIVSFGYSRLSFDSINGPEKDIVEEAFGHALLEVIDEKEK